MKAVVCVMLFSFCSVAMAGNLAGNGTGGIYDRSKILIFDFWEARNREFIHGIAPNLRPSPRSVSSVLAFLSLEAPRLSEEVGNCLSRMPTEPLPGIWRMRPPGDIYLPYLPTSDSELMRLATWNDQRNVIHFDAGALRLANVDFPGAMDVIRVHEAVYYIDRAYKARADVDSKWTRFVTACVYSNCARTELDDLTADIEWYLRGIDEPICSM